MNTQISKNEQKRLAKLNGKTKIKNDISEDEKYESLRKEKLNSAQIDLYPHIDNLKSNTNIKTLIETFNYLVQDKLSGAKLIEETFIIAGRVMLIRKGSKNLYFFTISSEENNLQVVGNLEDYGLDQNEFYKIMAQINRGDIVSVKGFMGTTKITEKEKDGKTIITGGELSLYATEMNLLCPCLKLLTSQHVGFTDIDARAKKRYLDMMLNQKVISTLKTRSKILQFIRKYLDELSFTEVQTPILTNNIGGANAEPFMTRHNALKQDMFLRIAPELYLKTLVIGGLERVYEIGSQFRNESIDGTHVPEFTSIEFYMAYANFDDMMKMCEELLSKMVLELFNTHDVKYNGNIINFAPPFKKINIMDELSLLTGVEFPDNLFEAELFLDKLCTEKNVECSNPRTTNRLLDKLIGHYIEPQCNNPTFLVGHPMIMSPLAKANEKNSNVAERFELFVNCFEIANAYTEQNSPDIQLSQFQNQQKDRDSGDSEAPIPDQGFIEALKYGLPPTGGYGMGIDRLVMLLTDNNNIREVIAFPPTTLNVVL